MSVQEPMNIKVQIADTGGDNAIWVTVKAESNDPPPDNNPPAYPPSRVLMAWVSEDGWDESLVLDTTQPGVRRIIYNSKAGQEVLKEIAV